MNVTFPVVKRKFLHSFPRIHTLFALTSVLFAFFVLLYIWEERNKKKKIIKQILIELNVNKCVAYVRLSCD